MQHTQLYINGAHTSATSNETFTSINPATGQPLGTIDQASQGDVDAAVVSAQAGFAIWSAMMPVERARILQKAARILRERNDELAQLEVLDTGKPLQEANCVDIVSGADVIEYYAGLICGMQGTQQDLGKDAFFMSRREPLGVCAGIGAWNYPIQIACWKSGPCLAAGNTMVFKPSEETPLSVMKLAEIYTEAGVPDGVFNVVQGDFRVGQMLTAHKDVAKVSFTGESGTGKKIMSDSASNLKQVTMELGGKSPMLVFDDAKLDNAVAGAMLANFYTQGEVCTNGTRVFVQRGLYETFVAKLGPRTEALKMGDPFDPEVMVGPLISREHHDKVMGYMNAALASDARHVCGGAVPSDPELANGNYVTPAIFADCDDDMVFVKEEVFGPLMSVLPFDHEEEALSRANNTNYGLSGAVFTRDFARAHRVANAIEAGNVWINSYNDLPPSIPFGGVKQSGYGRENGLVTLDHFTQWKTIYSNLGTFEAYY